MLSQPVHVAIYVDLVKSACQNQMITAFPFLTQYHMSLPLQNALHVACECGYILSQELCKMLLLE